MTEKNVEWDKKNQIKQTKLISLQDSFYGPSNIVAKFIHRTKQKVVDRLSRHTYAIKSHIGLDQFMHSETAALVSGKAKPAISYDYFTWMKVFRIIPEFKILRLTFH